MNDEPMSDEPMNASAVFTDAELAYLASMPLGRLATMHPDGTLQVNPVGLFRWNPATRTIDIGGHGMSRSRKFRNVADNGRAAFVVDDIPSTDPWRVRCLDVRGVAEAVERPDDPAAWPVDGIDDPAIIRFHPRRIIGMAVEDPRVEPHRIRPNARDVRPA